MQEKKVPMRTCIACRQEKPKREMLRICKSPAGEISLDFSGKLSGRGAYVCPCETCIKRLSKGQLLKKVFSAPVDESVYRRLEEEFFGK